MQLKQTIELGNWTKCEIWMYDFQILFIY